MKKREVIPPSDAEILAYTSVPPDVAGRYINMSTPTIYAGLQQDRVPFGFAVENKETGTWTYNISPGGLVKYKHEGKPIVRLGDLREVLSDFVKDYIDTRMGGLSKVLEAVLSA